jgi:chromosomal replication initiation ATPase DnaA
MTRAALESRGLLPVAEAVARRHFVTLTALLGKKRTRDLADARAELCYELYDLLRSYVAVGTLLGLDHCSVIAARRKWAAVVGDVGPAKVAPAAFRHPSTVMGGGR